EPTAAAELSAEMAASAHAHNPTTLVEIPATRPTDAAPPASDGLIARLRRTGTDVALMGAQLVDWPFAWMEELQKNIIGVAALLLALGGVVLWAFARWTN